MATVVDTEELRQEIEADRKELERLVVEFTKELETPILEKEAAYRYLLKREGKSAVTIARQGSLPLPDSLIRRPLSEDIKDTLPALSGKEFINADVESILGREGIRPRITNELTKLVGQGILECVHIGRGRTPSRFKVKGKGNDLV